LGKKNGTGAKGGDGKKKAWKKKKKKYTGKAPLKNALMATKKRVEEKKKEKHS